MFYQTLCNDNRNTLQAFKVLNQKCVEELQKCAYERESVESIVETSQNHIEGLRRWLKKRTSSCRKFARQLERLETELQDQTGLVQQRIIEMRANRAQASYTDNDKHQVLTPARIQQIHQFQAVVDRCSVCQDDIEDGQTMMRLDCRGQHVFCEDCVEGWFADHKTCPNCRHEFQ